MTNLLFLDIETTGREDQEPIQIYMEYWEDYWTKEVPTWARDLHVKPGESILPCAVVVHGISNAEAQKYSDPKETAQLVLDVLKALPKPLVIVGQNIKFDIKCLHEFLLRHLKISVNFKHTICTWRMAEKLINKDLLGNYKLDTIYYYLFPDKLRELLQARNSHDAGADIKLTEEVFRELCYNMSLELSDEGGDASPCPTAQEIIDWCNEPQLLPAWPFGKHGGEPFSVNKGYARWFVQQKDAHEKPDVVFSILTEFPDLKSYYTEPNGDS